MKLPLPLPGRHASPLQLHKQLLNEHSPPSHVRVLGYARKPAIVAAARRLYAATGTARHLHNAEACALAGQHLQEVHVVFDQGAAEAAKLRHIELISGNGPALQAQAERRRAGPRS